MSINPLDLAKSLIRCKSVTPIEDGVITLCEKILMDAGFTCHRLKFQEDGTEAVDNLYARIGASAPNFCFAGHTDVVPVGDLARWTSDPFDPVIKDGILYGRGASDMKGAVAAFITAGVRYVEKHGAPKGSISFLITNDEEAVSINGTKKVLEWLESRKEKIDACVVGEPSNPSALGEMIKIGRRGTLTGWITVKGKQGHVAYPHLADNPVPKIINLLSALNALKFDDGTAHFQPTNLEIVSIDTGNTAANIIPAQIRALFNVRFNDTWTGETLERKIRTTLDGQNIPHEMTIRVGGECFLTPPGLLSTLVSEVVHEMTERTPELSTTGGTSDARFISKYCPVVEFGGVNETIHQVNECARVTDIEKLADIYLKILERFFKN